MRKQFVRLFLSFVLVVAVVLGIQGIVVVASLQNQRTSWTESVFQEYLDTFTANLRAGISSTPSSFYAIEQLLLVSADDRVSGLYIRNPDGTVAVAYGNTSSGNSLPIPRPRPSEGPMTTMHHDLPMAEEAIGDQGFTSSEMHSDVYVVKILQSGSVTSLMVSKQSERQKQTILLPAQVKANDIAGSMVIMYNNEVLGMVDVLTYTPFTYKNTGRLFKGLLYPFLWAMPFAFIIALLMAASVSRRSQRYTSGIQAALQHLSSGENGVELPSTKIDEQKVINASIRQLDENLLLNKVSRQAWLRSISHDLNTPVASMKLLLDGMSDGVFPVTEQMLRNLKRENDTLSDRIALVSLYANLQSPDTKATQSELDVASFIQQVFDAFSDEQKDRIYIDADDARLIADQKLLSYACKALLSNALQASDESVGWAIGENCMTFTNTGHLAEGIDFFEPWTKGDSSRGTAGSGLGLPIVKQVMRLHQGTAIIEGREGNVIVSLRW